MSDPHYQPGRVTVTLDADAGAGHVLRCDSPSTTRACAIIRRDLGKKSPDRITVGYPSYEMVRSDGSRVGGEMALNWFYKMAARWILDGEK